jgi:hypothetical protein
VSDSRTSGYRTPVKFVLIGAMAAGSITVWIVNPVVWLWITSRLQSTQVRMGPYALMIAGIILTAVVLGKCLVLLNRRYGEVTGTTPTIHVIVPWRRSVRGGRSQARETDGRLPMSVLDVVMIASVAVALVALGLWFLITNPTPPGIGPGGFKD